MAALQSLLDFALDVTWRAGRITLRYFQTGIAVERKGDNSPVTLADRESEQYLRGAINRYYPDHGIIGEEYGEQASRSEFRWIIDPIDGTKSFVSGVPLYGCLLALVERDHPIVGVAHFPALDETISASVGGGCYWNGRRACVSSVAKLEEATLLASEISRTWENRPEAWRKLNASTYIQRTWGDAYGYALVATGRAEMMFDPKMQIWDCAPFGVILPEAGGTFTDFKGNATISAGESVATNGALFDPVMALLNDSQA
ncbi:MAG: inositol monophosphatase family protein [Chloroflexi bacterium]|nr:inositol monophosphatase family protein [Chloroflexota bacterium]